MAVRAPILNPPRASVDPAIRALQFPIPPPPLQPPRQLSLGASEGSLGVSWLVPSSSFVLHDTGQQITGRIWPGTFLLPAPSRARRTRRSAAPASGIIAWCFCRDQRLQLTANPRERTRMRMQPGTMVNNSDARLDRRRQRNGSTTCSKAKNRGGLTDATSHHS